MVLGLGRREKIDWLEVQWPMPGGTAQRFTDLPINRYITIVEGQNQRKENASGQQGIYSRSDK
jgi:hypothetical protein